MLKTLIKRDGSEQATDLSKVIRWAVWAAGELEGRIDWSSVVTGALETLPDRSTTVDLQMRMIKILREKRTWAANMMAGKLYSTVINKAVHPNGHPKLKDLHTQLLHLGLMRKLNYSDAEYAYCDTLLRHERDFQATYFELHQIREKYSIINEVTKQEYETQQYVYMRMAMALAEDQPADRRLMDLGHLYDLFSRKVINAPTPNYLNLGTPLRGFASCCLYAVDDNCPSLAIGDHIAYTMTYKSAGLGNVMSLRSEGDPIRGGAILHQGKKPYYDSMAGAKDANLQNGRGGACTTYYSGYDPDAMKVMWLRNPRSTDANRQNKLDYCLQTNKFMARMVAEGQQMFTFNAFTAPDLHEALFGDGTLFERLYRKYEADPSFKKNYVPAREVIIQKRNQQYETGRGYFAWMDEANRHTPFKDPLRSSNLCVAPETKIITPEGEFGIRELHERQDKTTTIWNGFEWSDVEIVQTGRNQQLVVVVLASGKELACTYYHKWYYLKDGVTTMVPTTELPLGAKLLPFSLPDAPETLIEEEVVDIIDYARVDDTYCFTEPKRHMGVFNGILTGQCTEVFLPTQAYNDMMDLYSTEDHGRGEVGICSLAGIVLPNVRDDEEYALACYYSLLMIDKCIHAAEYALPHVGFTAKQRLSAGVGLTGLATYFARMNLKYSDIEAKQESHRLAETHMYHLINASIKLGEELGNAPWIHKTKWPEGWTPLDTYNRNVDKIAGFELQRDWQDVKRRLIKQGGGRFSVLAAFMPTESSSKASGQPNSLYPVRFLSMLKTDQETVIDWCAPDNDIIGHQYQKAWDVPFRDLIDHYAIWQKWTDQGLSADTYRVIAAGETISSSEMISEYLYMTQMGLKSCYYTNSLTSKAADAKKDAKPEAKPSVVAKIVESVTDPKVGRGFTSPAIHLDGSPYEYVPAAPLVTSIGTGGSSSPTPSGTGGSTSAMDRIAAQARASIAAAALQNEEEGVFVGNDGAACSSGGCSL